MLLTITTTHSPATDLGYLLVKHPARFQSFPLTFGLAHVFYPDASPERCTAALAVEVDPVGLVRGRRGPSGDAGALESYVNDRPYAASSLLSVAIAEVFASALAGRSKGREALAGTPIPLSASTPVLPSRGGERLLRRLFEPLGYAVTASPLPLDPRVPDWGDSPYFSVTIEGRQRVRDLLAHLYVLVPVLDDDKHYWVGDAEVEKLLRHGEGWLAGHPERELITSRYLKHQRRLTRAALARLVEEDLGDADAEDVRITHGLAESLAQLAKEPAAFVERVKAFLDGLVSHYVLDGGRLVVAHAGLKAEMQGRGSREVREFCLYGETTGETDEYGLPRRYDWAADYRGSATVVYGHTPVPEPEWLNQTICIDTGCVFGGRLTALRYPERELVSVPAARTYYEPAKPFLPPEAQAPPLTAQQRHDELLDLTDVSGARAVTTRLAGRVTVREAEAAAALEAMARFAVDPRWLVHLPPTMSPPETSREPGILEHPAEAFAYFRHEGVGRVVCEEKHMGSRAVVVLCRTEAAARARFGIERDGAGIVYTRTGRRFFDDRAVETALLDRVRAAAEAAGLFSSLESDWLLLDAEVMPWSAKALALLREQYAPTGAAAVTVLERTLEALERTGRRGVDTGPVLARVAARAEMSRRFVDAYRRYCWPVASIEDLRLAPFHLLASEGAVHAGRDHGWHLTTLRRLASADPHLLLETRAIEVDVTDPASTAAATAWWTDLTEAGGEGMVVKPLEFTAKGRRGLAQPGIKCRGPEYLRIIYGPEYSAPEHLERLRSRALGRKRSLALREFALGIEGLERFVRREPLRRVHECVFAVLALESEPVDPRL